MPLQIPHPDTALHLYRHILREATYLPPLARPWALEQIKSRFRDCQRAEEPRRYISQAHRQLRFLRAANAGHVERMRRICLLATGRLGRRRRQLASAYLTYPPPVDSTALEMKQKKGSSSDAMQRLQLAAWGQSSRPLKFPATTGTSWLVNWDLEKVRKLAESQYAQQERLPNWAAKKIRRTVDPRHVVVKENCWGLTLKPKQMTRKLQKHWVSIFSSLVPPLPQGEWDILKSLSEGTAPESMWQIPPRRPVAVAVGNDTAASVSTSDLPQQKWEEYANTPVRKLERKNSRRMKTLAGGLDEYSSHKGHPIGVRAFKARSLRRDIYTRVWEASPLVTQASNGQWRVMWGGAQQQPTPLKAALSDSLFFQGVNEEGQVLPGDGRVAM